MGTTQRVAKFITGTRYEDIPSPAIDMAKLCILDAIGCALHATALPPGRAVIGLAEEVGGRPTSQIIGTALRVDPLSAAHANATLTHLDDFDDMGTGHHATLLMPVTLALGEERRSSGKDLLAAYVVGFDMTVYTTITLGSDHKGRGWHQTSTCGVMGTTAAASRLLGLDELRTRHAIGIASSHAGGIRAAFGTTTKALHPANAARAGILAAKLAARGFDANPDTIEDRFGFYAVFGEQQAQLVNLPRNLGNPWAMMARGRDVAKGITIKRWPSCGYTHAIATIIERLLRTHSFSAADVLGVDIATTNNPALMAANIRTPETPWQGKYSPWYTAASHLIDGRLDIDSFSDAAFARPQVHDLLRRITITQDRDFAGRPSRASGGEEWWDLTIRLRNGTSIVADRYEGHGDAWGWADRELVYDKFRGLAGSVLDAAHADRILNAVMDLDRSADVSGLSRLLAAPAAVLAASA